jgi:hypothetical protein
VLGGGNIGVGRGSDGVGHCGGGFLVFGGFGLLFCGGESRGGSGECVTRSVRQVMNGENGAVGDYNGNCCRLPSRARVWCGGSGVGLGMELPRDSGGGGVLLMTEAARL